MARKRIIEVFSAGCPTCTAVLELVNDLACPSCSVVVRDMHDPEVAESATALGVRSLPSVAIDGALAECCVRSGPNAATLQPAGLGRAID